MDSEFPSNSQRPKRPSEKVEPKKVDKIVQGEVIRRKKPLSRRLSEVFVGGDTRSVGSFIAFDILIPAMKDTIADAVSQGIERMIFGEARSTSRRGPSRYSSTPVNYTRYSGNNYRPQTPEPRRDISRRSRANHNFDEIVLETRVEAEEVIDRLFDIVSRYEQASVADLYDLVGIQGDFTDQKWGWRDIRGADVTRVSNGYLLDIPRPEPLD